MKTSSNRCGLPLTPTDARPGSEEKIRVLAERVRMRVSLWHPLDATLVSSTGAPKAHQASMSLAS